MNPKCEGHLTGSDSREANENGPVGGALAPPPPDGGASQGAGGPAEADLDTLAKAPHPDGESGETAPEEETSRETMTRRARSKWLTEKVVRRMEEEVPDSPIPYGKARGCCSVVRQEDGCLQCSYCKQRWCVVCQRIRMGRAINEYLPILSGWAEESDVFFVSLTRPNVQGGELRDEVGDMIHQFGLCMQQIRRTRELEFKAVRCIECTFNAERGDFNPHFHVAVKGKEQAEALREEWLKRHEDASPRAQDVTQWDGKPDGLLELVKYATKLFVPENGERADGTTQKEPMDAEALDTIFRALYRRHLLRPLGFAKEEEREKATTEAEVEQAEDVDDFDEDELESTVSAYIRPGEKCLWEWDGSDWWNQQTGEPLTGHEPGEDPCSET